RHRLDELRVGNLAVRASFEVSFASLPAAARGGPHPPRAFRLLGLWAGPSISLPAPSALLGAGEGAGGGAPDGLVEPPPFAGPRRGPCAGPAPCGGSPGPPAPAPGRPGGPAPRRPPACSPGTCTPGRGRPGSSLRSADRCRLTGPARRCVRWNSATSTRPLPG